MAGEDKGVGRRGRTGGEAKSHRSEGRCLSCRLGKQHQPGLRKERFPESPESPKSPAG